MDKYKIECRLGDGAFGEVAKATHPDTGDVVAIKRIKRHFRTWEECLQLRELQSLSLGAFLGRLVSFLGGSPEGDIGANIQYVMDFFEDFAKGVLSLLACFATLAVVVVEFRLSR